MTDIEWLDDISFIVHLHVQETSPYHIMHVAKLHMYKRPVN